MKLYELLILFFFGPACWFFWMWFFRIAAVWAISKLFGDLKDKLKGEKPNAHV
jgi:hypothetical protein